MKLVTEAEVLSMQRRAFYATCTISVPCLCAGGQEGPAPLHQGNFDGRPVRAIVVAEIGQIASALVLGRGGDEETAARAQRKIHEGAAAILGVP